MEIYVLGFPRHLPPLIASRCFLTDFSLLRLSFFLFVNPSSALFVEPEENKIMQNACSSAFLVNCFYWRGQFPSSFGFCFLSNSSMTKTTQSNWAHMCKLEIKIFCYYTSWGLAKLCFPYACQRLRIVGVMFLNACLKIFQFKMTSTG